MNLKSSLMSRLALSGLFEYLWYGSVGIRNILILSVRGLSLYVRTYKDSPRTKIINQASPAVGLLLGQRPLQWPNINLFTTIHDGNFRRHSSMNVTIK